MATGIILVILIMICVFGIKSYAGKLAHGCCGSGDGGKGEKRVRPSDKKRGNYPYEWKLRVDGMSCSGCERRMENAFHAEEGFLARADWKTGTVEVCKKEKVPEQRFRQIVKQAGYGFLGMEAVRNTA